MKSLKALVIFLGALLIGGFGLLIYGFATHLPRGDGRPTPAAARLAAPPKPVAPFGTVQVPVPDGAHVAQVVAVGGRLVVRLTGDDRLVVLDPRSGRVVGEFVLTPPAGAGGGR
jgi:hypothetical protein